MSSNESDIPTNVDAEGAGTKECFVIAPIGSPGSSTRKRTNGLLDEVIRPVLGGEYNYEVTVSHEMAEIGSIPQQVIQNLLTADLVIADLTERNPNVMYELAVRHATGRPVIPIDNEDESLPFDVATERTIPYEDAIHGPTQLKNDLREHVKGLEEGHEPNNPIYRAQQYEEIRGALGGYVREAIEGEAGEKLSALVDEMMSRLERMESRIPPKGGKTAVGKDSAAMEVAADEHPAPRRLAALINRDGIMKAEVVEYEGDGRYIRFHYPSNFTDEEAIDLYEEYSRHVESNTK